MSVTVGNRRLKLKKQGDAPAPDFYPTPAWATRALLAHETLDGSSIWEPACGDGSMSKVLAETECHIESSDLFDYGFGTTGVDFLTAHPIYPTHIVTNPPFSLAERFVERALMQVQHKACFLLRLAFIEGAGRYTKLYSLTPPARVWAFTRRITMYPGGVNQYDWDTKPDGSKAQGNGTTAYAWFVWDKQWDGETTELRWIPPSFGKDMDK